MEKVPYLDVSVEQLEILLDKKSYERFSVIFHEPDFMKGLLVGLVDSDRSKSQSMNNIIASVDMNHKFVTRKPSGLYLVEGASVGLYEDDVSGPLVKLEAPKVFREYFLPQHKFIPIYGGDIEKVKQ